MWLVGRLNDVGNHTLLQNTYGLQTPSFAQFQTKLVKLHLINDHTLNKFSKYLD